MPGAAGGIPLMFTLEFANGGRVCASDTQLPIECRHASTARSEAELAAEACDLPITVLRDGKASYVMLPDGSRRKPDGSWSPPGAACTRGTGRACFCTPCREERKAARA